MPLLNYTTTVSADKSITAIQKALAKAGASAILHEYDQSGTMMALSFRIKLEGQDISFRLPTDWRAVQKRLEAQRVEPRYRTQEHALRVAWELTLPKRSIKTLLTFLIHLVSSRSPEVATLKSSV